MELALNTGVNYPLEGPVKIHLSIEASLLLGKVMVVIPTGVTCDKGAQVGIHLIDLQTGMDTLHPHPGIPTIIHLHLIIHKEGTIRRLPGPIETERYLKGQAGHPKDLMALPLRETLVKDHRIFQPIVRVVLIRMSGVPSLTSPFKI